MLRLRQRFPDEPRGRVDEPLDGEIELRVEGELLAHDFAFFLLELFDVLVEPVQSGFPQMTARGQPVFDDLEPFGCDLIRPHSPALFRLHQPALFEHREVLHERRELHVERRRQLADGGWSDRQTLQHFPPSRVGQGVEDVVSGCGLNHVPHHPSARVVGSDGGILQPRNTFVNT